MTEEFYDRQKNEAGQFATFSFLIIALYLFISDGGFSSLFSLKSLLFFTIGMFVSALIIGIFQYSLQRFTSKILIALFDNPFSQRAVKLTKFIGLLLTAISLILTFLLTDMAYNTFIKTPNGVYVEISLKNDKNIGGYVIFNSEIKSLEECEATFEKILPTIMKNLPAPIPKDSIATGWKCSYTDPAKTKNIEDN